MGHQMFVFASKSATLPYKQFATVLLLPINDQGQPLPMDTAQAVNKIPEHLRSGGYKIANAYTILQALCEDKPRTMFTYTLKH